MSLIKVQSLTKTFQTYQPREGIWGSVKDLLQRSYKPFVAVDAISFDVKEGELLGYIGPNGAGKSTSIKMLTGILQPTSGSIDVLGFNPFRERKVYTKHIGVVFGQRTQLWWDIAVIESFKLLRKIYDVSEKDYKERLDNLTTILDLSQILHTPVRKLSLGQRMRADLAASLLHKPKVLFLDEPTIGLDAVGKDGIRSFLRQINRDFGTTIILTTHDLKEIEELCERIIVLDKGKIVYDGRLETVKHLPGLLRTITVDFFGVVTTDELIRVLPSTVKVKALSERRFEISFEVGSLSATEIVRPMLSSFEVADLIIAEPTIDDVIMKIYRDGISPVKKYAAHS